MRFKEFSSEENNIKFVKLTFQKVLNNLKANHEKKLKIYKEKLKIAKQDRKNKHLQSLKNTSTIGVKSLERPKRLK